MSQTTSKPALNPASSLDVTTSRSYSADEQAAVPPECAGTHFIVDFWGAINLKDAAAIEAALKAAASAAGAVLLHIHLHTFSGEGGVTGVALLAESHISVHTWPERDYAAFDVFMCGNSAPERAVALLKDIFKPTRVELQEIKRG